MAQTSEQVMQNGPGNPLVARFIEFVRFIRANGFSVGVQEELDTLKVAEYGHVIDLRRLHWGLRSLLCSNSEEWGRFDGLFDAYWRPAKRKAEVRSSLSRRMAPTNGLSAVLGQGGQVAELDQAQPDDASDAGEGGSKGGASAQEVHTRSDFHLLSNEAQMRELERLVERLARHMRRRITRRQRISQQGRRIHLRRTIRNSLRYGGTPLELAFKQRTRLLPRLILLLDVSRSMSLYSYLFLRFARGILDAFEDADAFVYHTRLVHVTDALREPDIARVKDKLALMSAGWSGGTRIGESLKTFNQEYGRRLVNSRSVVVVVSDGFDTGAPEFLAEQLGHIKRRARKLVWLNPLLGQAGYEPIAGGMQAALPLIDLFASAHNLESLLGLESYLVKL